MGKVITIGGTTKTAHGKDEIQQEDSLSSSREPLCELVFHRRRSY
jgi:hypothetical protein